MERDDDFRFEFDALSGPKPKPRTMAHAMLRVSLVVMATAIVAFTFLVPTWMNTGISQLTEGRLREVAAATAEATVENQWTAEQGRIFALQQIRLGGEPPEVTVTVNNFAVTVEMTSTIPSSNPFARLFGDDNVNRINVRHSQKK